MYCLITDRLSTKTGLSSISADLGLFAAFAQNVKWASLQELLKNESIQGQGTLPIRNKGIGAIQILL